MLTYLIVNIEETKYCTYGNKSIVLNYIFCDNNYIMDH